jgi:hypothetical protein
MTTRERPEGENGNGKGDNWRLSLPLPKNYLPPSFTGEKADWNGGKERGVLSRLEDYEGEIENTECECERRSHGPGGCEEPGEWIYKDKQEGILLCSQCLEEYEKERK